jgi:hypothetical protein
MMLKIWAGVRVASKDFSSPTIPATRGDAKEVPFQLAYDVGLV